jgi:hypothetical protein
LEHQLRNNLAFRVLGVYSKSWNNFRILSTFRPYEAYSVPVTNPDPGFDGLVGTPDDPGTTVTYYEFPLALAGKDFEQTMRVNDRSSDRTYKSIDLGVVKRYADGWHFSASYSATKKGVPVYPRLNINTGDAENPLVTGAALNPNTEINQADRTWDWQAKIAAAYTLPYAVLLSANFEHRSGIPFARQVLFRGGRTIPSIVLNVEPIGTRRLPNVNLLDFRVEKSFRPFDRDKLSLRVNVYNVLNHNTISELTMRAGNSFLRPTAIMPPRLIEVSTSYSF